MKTKRYKIKEKKTGIFWKYKNRFVRVFCEYLGKNRSYCVGIKTYEMKNGIELLSGLYFWSSLNGVVEFLEKNSNKEVELIEDCEVNK